MLMYWMSQILEMIDMRGAPLDHESAQARIELTLDPRSAHSSNDLDLAVKSKWPSCVRDKQSVMLWSDELMMRRRHSTPRIRCQHDNNIAEAAKQGKKNDKSNVTLLCSSTSTFTVSWCSGGPRAGSTVWSFLCFLSVTTQEEGIMRKSRVMKRSSNLLAFFSQSSQWNPRKEKAARWLPCCCGAAGSPFSHIHQQCIFFTIHHTNNCSHIECWTIIFEQ